MIALSPRQEETLLFIEDYTRANGFAPSFNDIATGMDRAISTVQHVVTVLEARGHIRRHPHVARSIVVIPRETEPYLDR